MKLVSLQAIKFTARKPSNCYLRDSFYFKFILSKGMYVLVIDIVVNSISMYSHYTYKLYKYINYFL